MLRGEVFRLRSMRGARGHEQTGGRFGVVVQSDEVAPLSTVLVAPTSTVARPATFRPEIEIEGTLTRVMTDQTTALDVRRLGRSAGRLDAHEVGAVDDAMRLVLAL